MKIDRNELDRHITGNYGEDQFRDDEPGFSARVVWESNGAVIECYLWDEPPGEWEDDLLELSIQPGEGQGKPHNLFMDLSDAWALVSVISQCALKLQTKIAEEKERLDAPQVQAKD